ncbi:hypothetical protein B0H67DRAFT_500832 [Lasiosphaeris hirsuta]|uniref:Heterokaryon incompatibility domain-containing protein n=1 Tax=Lasiosphaeris hirsuta TaxID=260670 RepID=A0AA39ZPG4_9PEZI|nr:hypothetical protein B0H67DRAFT_500832 [Lasiosphaeris hirsuta]
MWLLNTSTFTLKFNFEPSEYAILSHTWEKEEVTFSNMRDLDVAKKAGRTKIEQTCHIDRGHWNLGYVWIGTCCINKSSSAELSEAINSMFAWYQRATVL